MVVDGQHHFAFAGTHHFGQQLVLFPAECPAVAFALPVGRVSVEEAVRAVVAFETAVPGFVFDIHAVQSAPCCPQIFCNAGNAPCPCGGGRAKALSSGFTAEGSVLQVVETCGALDVGEGFGWGTLQQGEGLAAGQGPCKLAHEFVVVVLQDAVEVDQVAVDVIEHFDFGGRLAHEE